MTCSSFHCYMVSWNVSLGATLFQERHWHQLQSYDSTIGHTQMSVIRIHFLSVLPFWTKICFVVILFLHKWLMFFWGSSVISQTKNSTTYGQKLFYHQKILRKCAPHTVYPALCIWSCITLLLSWKPFFVLDYKVCLHCTRCIHLYSKFHRDNECFLLTVLSLTNFQESLAWNYQCYISGVKCTLLDVEVNKYWQCWITLAMRWMVVMLLLVLICL